MMIWIPMTFSSLTVDWRVVVVPCFFLSFFLSFFSFFSFLFGSYYLFGMASCARRTTPEIIFVFLPVGWISRCIFLSVFSSLSFFSISDGILSLDMLFLVVVFIIAGVFLVGWE